HVWIGTLVREASSLASTLSDARNMPKPPHSLKAEANRNLRPARTVEGLVASQTLRGPSAGFAERDPLGLTYPSRDATVADELQSLPWGTYGKSRPRLMASASGTPIAISSEELRRCAMKPPSIESSRLLSREPELGRISRRDRRASAPSERRRIAVRLFSMAVAGAQ